MVAALLHLHEPARQAFEAGYGIGGGFGDVGHTIGPCG